MALIDAINDDSDEFSEDGGETGDPTVGVDPRERERLYHQSFGPGRFSYDPSIGAIRFTSANELEKTSTDRLRQAMIGQGGGPQGVDYQPYEPSAQPTGRQQVTSLQQLAAVARATQHLPPELRQRVLAHVLGLPDPRQQARQQALQQALQIAKYRHQLGQPERIEKERQRRTEKAESFDIRREALSSREQQRQFQQLMAQQMLDLRKESRRSAIESHRDRAQNTIANSIANLTRAMESVTDENQRIQLGKLLQQQHQLYQRFHGMKGLESQEGREGFAIRRGEEY